MPLPTRLCLPFLGSCHAPARDRLALRPNRLTAEFADAPTFLLSLFGKKELEERTSGQNDRRADRQPRRAFKLRKGVT